MVWCLSKHPVDFSWHKLFCEILYEDLEDLHSIVSLTAAMLLAFPNRLCLSTICKDDLLVFLMFTVSQLQIERQAFECTVNQLNAIYAEAEKAGCSTYCEGCMACLTAYLIYICTETHYEKVGTFVVFRLILWGRFSWAVQSSEAWSWTINLNVMS